MLVVTFRGVLIIYINGVYHDPVTTTLLVSGFPRGGVSSTKLSTIIKRSTSTGTRRIVEISNLSVSSRVTGRVSRTLIAATSLVLAVSIGRAE